MLSLMPYPVYQPSDAVSSAAPFSPEPVPDLIEIPQSILANSQLDAWATLPGSPPPLTPRPDYEVLTPSTSTVTAAAAAAAAAAAPSVRTPAPVGAAAAAALAVITSTAAAAAHAAGSAMEDDDEDDVTIIGEKAKPCVAAVAVVPSDAERLARLMADGRESSPPAAAAAAAAPVPATAPAPSAPQINAPTSLVLLARALGAHIPAGPAQERLVADICHDPDVYAKCIVAEFNARTKTIEKIAARTIDDLMAKLHPSSSPDLKLVAKNLMLEIARNTASCFSINQSAPIRDLTDATELAEFTAAVDIELKAETSTTSLVIKCVMDSQRTMIETMYAQAHLVATAHDGDVFASLINNISLSHKQGVRLAMRCAAAVAVSMTLTSGKAFMGGSLNTIVRAASRAHPGKPVKLMELIGEAAAKYLGIADK